MDSDFDIDQFEPFDPSFTPPVHLPTFTDDIQGFLELIDPCDHPELPPDELNNGMLYHTNDVGGFVHENENNIAPLVSSVQLDCSGCHVLREVFHTNGKSECG